MRLTEIFNVLTRTLWINSSYKKDLIFDPLGTLELAQVFLFGFSSAVAAAPVALNHGDLAWAVAVNINSRCAGCSASVSARNHSRSRGTAGKMEHQ